MAIQTGFIYGCGAQGRVVLDILRDQFPDTVWSFLDDDGNNHGKTINGADVVGDISALAGQSHARVHVAIGKPSLKKKLVANCMEYAVRFVNAVHPSAVVLQSACLGEDVMIGANVVVGSNASIGDHVIINNGSVVEHDTVLHDYVNIAPAAVIGGRVEVADSAFVGSGAIVLARCRVGGNSIVGMGSVVTRDVPPDSLVYGVPARQVKPVTAGFDWSKVL